MCVGASDSSLVLDPLWFVNVFMYVTEALCLLVFVVYFLYRFLVQMFSFSALILLQCFDTVGWVAGRASGL